jgi:hypothetical protein
MKGMFAHLGARELDSIRYFAGHTRDITGRHEPARLRRDEFRDAAPGKGYDWRAAAHRLSNDQAVGLVPHRSH